MINKPYILISIITISALQASDDNQLKAPNISRHMSLKALRDLDAQADCIQLKARIAFRERKEDLLTQPASTISLEELEMLHTTLAREQHSKAKGNEQVCCAAVAAVGMGGLLACEALNENIPFISDTDPSLNQCCLAAGLGTALIGIIESAKIIMQPTMKHKIEELQQVIRDKKREKSE